jgi:hypothetical protein
MPNLPHLILPRAKDELPRKRTGYGRPPAREHDTHGEILRGQIETVLSEYKRRRRPLGIDPNLILRIQLNPKAGVDEETWERCGLTLLSVDENKTFILFSSDADLSDFKRRLSEYKEGPKRTNQKSAPHTQIFASIDEIGDLRPNDRIGRLLRAEGVNKTQDFEDSQEYLVDIEFWDFGSRDSNRAKIEEIRIFIRAEGGQTTDDYIGESLVLLRARCVGALIKQLLEIESIAVIDMPPKPTLTIAELLDVGIEDLPPVLSPDAGAPSVTVLDSGLTAAHPLLAPAVGEATSVPRSLGDSSDGHGHGTMVAGIALYGDVEACIRSRSFVPRLTLYSARVLNDQCKFDDENLITSQMRQAIEYFRNTYGCRVFNVSLGDARLPYRGGKVSPWASILDTLSRDLDVVIVVSAGNYNYVPGPGNSTDAHVQDYPRYLLGEDARIIEPATGAIVLTVGALAYSSNAPQNSAGNSVAFRPIARGNQPSPFTRSGPGLGDSIKPELCEVGGNCAYDGLARRVRNVRELSVISMNREYIQRLFNTDTGTSFAAAKVAHMAAHLFGTFPNVSANLIRTLLVASAELPRASLELLSSFDSKAQLQLCGYGQPNLELASSSNESRVVLYAESHIAFDNFHIYEVPIPSEFIHEKGIRRISVSLAYDPPVRHTRFDYLGVKMSFRLIRGKSIDEIAEAFRQRGRKEEQVDRLSSTNYDCLIEPKPSIREGGTLQKGTFTMRRAPQTDFGDTYYLVVRCEKKWAREEHGPQRYAVVVALEHTAEINIYDRIRDRVQAAIRVRARR